MTPLCLAGAWTVSRIHRWSLRLNRVLPAKGIKHSNELLKPSDFHANLIIVAIITVQRARDEISAEQSYHPVKLSVPSGPGHDGFSLRELASVLRFQIKT